MVCAIYWLRFRDTSSSCDASSKRYVITNPPDDFSLLPTDQVSYSCNYNLYVLTVGHSPFTLCFHIHSSCSCTCSFSIIFCIFSHLIFLPSFWPPYCCLSDIFIFVVVKGIILLSMHNICANYFIFHFIKFSCSSYPLSGL
jgi:hypothetical protein